MTNNEPSSICHLCGEPSEDGHAWCDECSNVLFTEERLAAYETQSMATYELRREVRQLQKAVKERDDLLLKHVGIAGRNIDLNRRLNKAKKCVLYVKDRLGLPDQGWVAEFKQFCEEILEK